MTDITQPPNALNQGDPHAASRPLLMIYETLRGLN
jgi:hypothetical protein